jgi:CRP-like cAMP-binding protein
MHPSRNHVLGSLADAHHSLLVPYLEAVELPLRFVAERHGQRVDYVYFPDQGLISVVVDLGGRHQSEAGTVGWDTCTGHSVILGGGVAITTTYLQIPGRGHRIQAAKLRDLMNEHPALRHHFTSTVEAFAAQATFTIVTNSRGKLEERLSRWLLMAHDRMEGDVIPITHDLLSVMLGVRRPGVTTALQYLEDRNAVVTDRGKITVQDRTFLERVAGPFYGPAEAAHTRLTGWRPKQPGSASVREVR